MKKTEFLCLLAAMICGSIFAQSNNPTTTIKGTLKLNGERFSVVSGNITYNVRGLERYVDVINGLKEGAQVSIDGYVSDTTLEGQNNRLFYPVTLTLNGKTYEVGSPNAANSGTGRNGNGTFSSGRDR